MRVLEFLVLVSAFWTCFAKHKKNERKLPYFVSICSRSDPHLNQCVKSSIQSLQPKLEVGIPEMLIPSLDPLRLPYISLRENGLDVSFEDLKIEHLNRNNITHVSFNFEKNQIRIKQMLPLVRMTCDYKVLGKILILQLRGSGSFEGNFTDVTADVHMFGKREVRGGKEHFVFDEAKVRLTMGDARLHLEGLFADQKLNEATNEIINSNIKEFLVELMPLIEASIENLVLQMTRKFFEAFDIDTLFLP